MEKRDVNQIYGEYYYSDGREMATEMEVVFQIVKIDGIKKVFFLSYGLTIDYSKLTILFYRSEIQTPTMPPSTWRVA